MKKLFLLCSVAFMFACSNENEVLTQENATIENATTTASKSEIPIEDEIDEMFYEYVNSSEFIEVYERQIEYFEKLNYEGDINEINTYSKLISWLDSNIENTYYENLETAISDIDNLLALYNNRRNKFPLVFEFIEVSPVSVVISKIDKWFPNDLVTNSNRVCEKNFSDCQNTVSTTYEKTLLDLRDNESIGDADRNAAANNAESAYNNGMRACRNTYKECMG